MKQHAEKQRASHHPGAAASSPAASVGKRTARFGWRRDRHGPRAAQPATVDLRHFPNTGPAVIQRRITIVGTSHVAEASIRAVRDTIASEQPDCVAVELDDLRYHVLQGDVKAKLNISLVSLMKILQDWIGRRVGIMPGAEMLAAVRVAQERGIPVHFIDQDIRITADRIRRLPIREKARLLGLLIKASVLLPLSPLFKHRIDLRNVPQQRLIDRAMEDLRIQMPALYRILLEERDLHMAGRLHELSNRFPRIVAVVGAGHARHLTAMLNGKK